jgi:hypothetical protein
VPEPTATTDRTATDQAATRQRATTPECRSGELKLGLVDGGAATSHDFEILTFTNTSSRSRFIVGFPGVSYVAGDNGAQVGAPAVREGSIGPRATLAHGAVASTAIDSISTACGTRRSAGRPRCAASACIRRTSARPSSYRWAAVHSAARAIPAAPN